MHTFMDGFAGIWPAIAVILTFGITLGQVVYRLGQAMARLAALEEWRLRVRVDMHEVSKAMQDLTAEIRELKTLIEERTDRRDKVRT